MKKKLLYYFGVSIIFLASFCFYSASFYPLLNADNAVTILQTHNFNLPDDLYFWGQDRMGSLIPLLAQIPFKLFNLSAVSSESIAHYTVLLLGFSAFSTFIKSKFYKLIFALIWFLPPMRLIDITQLSFGIHYSLIAIICYLLKLKEQEWLKRNRLLSNFNLLLIVISSITAVWVSDLALVSLSLLFGVLFYNYIKNNKLSHDIWRKAELYYFIIGIVGTYLFISYAKSISTVKHEYVTFSNPTTIKQTLEIFFNSIGEIFMFRAGEPFTSIYSYLLILVFGFTFFVLKKVNFDSQIKKWAMFFLIDIFILFGIIIISEWTFLNGVPRRYFTCTYISLAFFLILFFDNLKANVYCLKYFKLILVLTVLLGGLGTIYNLKYIWPKTLKPMVEVVGEFKKLGKIGIISNYWNSYITSAVDPENIVATPHDTTWSVRNYKLVDQVFNQPKIYVIKDSWFEHFPDTMHEFGRTLIKVDAEFRMGNCSVCQYKKLK